MRTAHADLLPAPPDGADLVDAVRASLRLLELGPDEIMATRRALEELAAEGGGPAADHDARR